MLAKRRIFETLISPGYYVAQTIGLVLSYLLVAGFVRAIGSSGFDWELHPAYGLIGRTLVGAFGATFANKLFAEGHFLFTLHIAFLPVLLYLAVSSVFRSGLEKKVGALELLTYGPADAISSFVATLIKDILLTAVYLAALLVFLLFPIKEKEHRAILEVIEAHKRGESAEDPLTGRSVPPPADRGIDEETGWFLDHFSKRELTRFARQGARSLVRSTALSAIVSFAISAAAIGTVIASLGELSEKPGASVVFLVVIGGFALTAGLYHLLRVRAALRMRTQPIQAQTVDSHLEVTESLRQIQRAA